MRKTYWLILAIIIVSCTTKDKEYVTLKGKLNTTGIDKFSIKGRGYSKEINVNSEGYFSDTLRVTDGVHAIVNGTDRITFFLKNGYDLDLELKGEKFSDGISYQGIGAETNNFMENKRLFYKSEYASPETYFSLNKEDYVAKLAEAKSLLKSYKDNTPNLDSVIDKMDIRNDSLFFGYIELNYERESRILEGKVSPIFENYENYEGGTSSLEDFKGTYVFIDVWATWCAPCKAEIPFLKALEKEYLGKNITFVSISIDYPNAYDRWKQMVKDEGLGGVQLLADNNYESDFMVAYGIKVIPRFILIDPEGKIVDVEAPNPSNPKLKEMFISLGI
jgi:thiol-disulfide isomerase/thioredoxin